MSMRFLFFKHILLVLVTFGANCKLKLHPDEVYMNKVSFFVRGFDIP